jgi:hypothetical protein
MGFRLTFRIIIFTIFSVKNQVIENLAWVKKVFSEVTNGKRQADAMKLLETSGTEGVTYMEMYFLEKLLIFVCLKMRNLRFPRTKFSISTES